MAKTNRARTAAPQALMTGGEPLAFLAEALDCLRIAITIFDAQERLVYANAHFDYLLQVLPRRGALTGKTYDELIRLEIVRGVTAPEAALADVESYIAGRRAQLHDNSHKPRDIVLADGRIVEIKTRPLPRGGWIALWSDVTEARHAAGRLGTAIELSADAFAFFDRSDRLVLCNADYAQFLGSDPAALVGARFSDIIRRADTRGITPAEPQEREKWVERRLEMHRAPVGTLTVQMPDGQAYLVRDRATRDGGRVIVFTDVTDRRRTEAALAEQTSALDRTRRALAKSQAETYRQASYLADLTRQLGEVTAGADNAKTTLLRTMSHELKTPLNAIIGFSDLLATMADRLSHEQVREYAGLIHQGGRNLLRLINQILDLTKIAAGRYEIKRVPVDVAAHLTQAKAEYDARAAIRKITLYTEACESGLMADVDENALSAMVQNLIENALAVLPAGGAVCLSADADGGAVRITVADNGPGVAREDLARILEPFEQGGHNANDHSSGAGLGLTLVKAFVELHGGRFVIDSAPDDGFCATILLPRAHV